VTPGIAMVLYGGIYFVRITKSSGKTTLILCVGRASACGGFQERLVHA